MPSKSQQYRTMRPGKLQRPVARRLRVYALDPTLATQLANTSINQITLKVPWEVEHSSGADLLKPGPIGEYVEVIDVDPASKCAYAPVNLDDPYLLAQDGHTPSESNPQFHQQMVYAVAMTTIKNFERALGRTAFWADHRVKTNEKVGTETKTKYAEYYVQRLRIYPHALREANAYYSPTKKALLFGYFRAQPGDARDLMPDTTVFTCLSHDIIAHETTHALLDGTHHRYGEPSNPDVLAFHEAFADIVALFQHFTFPEVLRQQIAQSRGDLASENLLAQLAQQFGRGLESTGALRDALGEVVDGRWRRRQADPTILERVWEPHARGAILVAAVFDAFVAIYKSRIADLLRIASKGTGVLASGELQPDLVNRMAQEASKAASHVLTMCIRALDYCPPVDITFGEYLRAVITADFDLVPDDELGYRVAVIESFRRHGIYPPGVRTLSIDSLLWNGPNPDEALFCSSIVGAVGTKAQEWDLSNDRREIWTALRTIRGRLHEYLDAEVQSAPNANAPHRNATRTTDSTNIQRYLGLNLGLGNGKFEIHSVRPSRRVSQDGDVHTDIIVVITQQRPGYVDPATQTKRDAPTHSKRDSAQSYADADFTFRGGCTLIIDMENACVRYCIRKRIDNEKRFESQRAYLTGEIGQSLHATYFGGLGASSNEPFAMLHRSS
jgi:hypothetical protein